MPRNGKAKVLINDELGAVLAAIETPVPVRQLLERRSETARSDEPVNALFGRWLNLAKAQRQMHPATIQALRSSIGVLAAFNDVRNNYSLAHPNELLPATEARLIADHVVATFRYVGAVER